jgi:N-acetylneuraminic acid mutarotase
VYKKTALSALFTAVLLISIVAGIQAADVPYVSSLGNPWTAKTSLPTPTVGLEAAVVNGKIYAFKGSITYENNPGAMWTTKSSMPTWRSDIAVATDQNEIYGIGGRTNDSTTTGTNQVYDPADDSWKTLTSMPTPRHSLDANVVDGKIYLIGGLVPHHLYPNDKTTYEATNANEVYDPATDSWTTKTPVPNAVHNYASAVVNNKIYIISETLTQIYNQTTTHGALARLRRIQ